MGRVVHEGNLHFIRAWAFLGVPCMFVGESKFCTSVGLVRGE